MLLVLIKPRLQSLHSVSIPRLSDNWKHTCSLTQSYTHARMLRHTHTHTHTRTRTQYMCVVPLALTLHFLRCTDTERIRDYSAHTDTHTHTNTLVHSYIHTDIKTHTTNSDSFTRLPVRMLDLEN